MVHRLPDPKAVTSKDTVGTASSERRGAGEGIVPYAIVCLLLWTIIGGLLLLNTRPSQSCVFIGFIGSGHHQWVVDDGSLYLDMIEQAQNGSWLFNNRFSPEINSPRYLNSVWAVVGKSGAVIGLDPLASFTLFRFAAVVILLIALRRALREFLPNPKSRSLALVLIVFGGGLGWVFGIISRWFGPVYPFFIEAKKSEVWSFLPLMIGPHNILAMSLVILVMTGLVASSRGSRKACSIVPLIALALATFHPYDLPVVYSVGGVFLVMLWLRDRKINRTLLITYISTAAISLPVLAYHYWALKTTPDLRGLFLQNDIQPYGSLRFIAGLLPLGIIALRQFSVKLADYKSAGNAELLIISWALALPVLLYSYPDVGFAWKLTIGMPLPICVLAVWWMEERGSSNIPLWRSSPAITGVVAVSLLSSAFITLAMAYTARKHATPYYITRAEYDALTWLGTQPGRDDTVLSARFPGIYIPRFAHKHAWAAHDHQSVDFANRTGVVSRLLTDGRLSLDKLQTLRRHRVRWIFYGKNERKWWPEPPPSPALSLVYNKDSIRIYKVE